MKKVAIHMKIVGNKMYQHVADNRFLASILFLLYRFYQKIRYQESRICNRRATPYWKGDSPVKKSKLKDVTVAVICDEMTWINWKQECQVLTLTPHNWRKVLCHERPDFFFCESTWTGLKKQNKCWHGQIYRNHRLLFENRKELLRILSFCKHYKIPTVFWNKEDPTYFASTRYDFKDTALKFDWIFTTAVECVPLYKALGHKQVDVMMFSFSPYLFNPLGCFPKERKAVFAGSWFGEDSNRCRAMEQIFDKVLQQNIPLVIYNRQTGNAKNGRNYPEKYQPYVSAGVLFEQLGKELKHAMYAININTVTKSDTMFARRVFEQMAMNTVIISNDSKGMNRLFPDSIWYLTKSLSEKEQERIARRNIDTVFKYHTNEVRFTSMLQKIGILEEQKKVNIAVLIERKERQKEKEKKEEESRQWVKRWEGERFIAECTYEQSYTFAEQRDYKYGILLGEEEILDFDKVLSHFCYIPKGCGIRLAGKGGFVIVEDAEHEDVLYPWDIFEKVLSEKRCNTMKYLIGRNEG